MFPILLLVLLFINSANSAFIDSDQEKLGECRKLLSEKLTLSLRIKDDFLSIINDIDSLRKSDIIKKPIEDISERLNNLQITDIESIMNAVDAFTSPAQDIYRETTRLRNRFNSLRQSALSLITTENRTALAENLSSPLQKLLPSANTEFLASIEEFVKYEKLAELRNSLNDTLLTYKHYADSIRKYGDNAIQQLSVAGRDSLRKYIYLSEQISLFGSIADSATKYASYKDSIIDRIPIPSLYSAGKSWKDSIETYVSLRDSLRSVLEREAKTYADAEKTELAQKAHELRAQISGYNYLRDTIAFYAANPLRLAELVPGASVAANEIFSIAAGKTPNAESAKEIACALFNTLFPDRRGIIDSAQKYFRYITFVKNEKRYRDSIANANSEAAKEIFQKKLLAVSGYEDSLRTFSRYRDSLILKLPTPQWIGQGEAWQDTLRRFAKVKDSMTLLTKESALSSQRRIELSPLLAAYKDSLAAYIRFVDTIAQFIDNPEKLISYTPLRPYFEKAVLYRDTLRIWSSYRVTIELHMQSQPNPWKMLDTLSIESSIKEKMRRYVAYTDSIKKYEELKERLFSEGAIVLLAFSGKAASALSSLTGLFSNIGEIQSGAESILKGNADAKEIATTVVKAIGKSFFPDQAALFDNLQTYLSAVAEVKELADIRAKITNYGRFNSVLNTDNTAELNELTNAGRDSLASYRALLSRIGEIENATEVVARNCHLLDTLINRLPVPDWLGKGRFWQDSIKQYASLRDTIKAQKIRLLSATAAEKSALEAKIAANITEFNAYRRFNDTIKAYIEAPEKLIAHTPLTNLFADNSNKLLKDQLINQGAVALIAFTGKGSAALSVIAGITGKLSTVTNEVEAILDANKSAKDIALSLGNSIGRALFPEQSELIESAQSYFSMATELKEIAEIRGKLTDFARYAPFVNADDITILSELSEKGRDSLASYKALLGRMAEIANMEERAESFRPYIDSLISNLPIPEWLGKGLSWQDSIKHYAELRNSIRSLKNELTTASESERSRLQNELNSIMSEFNSYRRFHDTIKAYIESPEKLIEHTPLSDMFASGSNRNLQEQLVNQGTIVLMAFAGNSVSLPFAGNILGPLATIASFKDSLSKYMEIVRNLRSNIDTLDALLRDPFRILNKFPKVKEIYDALNLQPSTITFPPVNSLLDQVRGHMAPYLQKVDELIKYGDDAVQLAESIPGREAFFNGFIASVGNFPLRFRNKRFFSPGIDISLKAPDISETTHYDEFEFVYNTSTMLTMQTDTAPSQKIKSNLTTISYKIDREAKHSVISTNGSLDSEIPGETTSEVVEIDYQSSKIPQWTRDGVSLFSSRLFSEITPYTQNDKNEIEVIKQDGLLGFDLKKIGWKIFFAEKLDNPWPLMVQTKTIMADIKYKTVSSLPFPVYIRFLPLSETSNSITWKLSEEGNKIE